MISKKIFIFYLSLFVNSGMIFAEDKDFIDFGIRGHVYDVGEKSFKEEIAAKLKQIDYSYWEKEMLDSANRSMQIESTKPNCLENKSYEHNPSFVIDQDIVIPYMNKVLFKKGYVYNPLKENNIKFKTHQIFINADDVHQLMLAVKYANQADIFVVKGNIKNILDYDVQAYIFREDIEGKSFKINCLPTTFTQNNFNFIVNEYLLNDEQSNKELKND